MKLEEATETAIKFLRDPAGYAYPRLHSVDQVGELWSCVYNVGPPMKEEELVEVLLGEGRIMGFRKK